MNKRCLTSIYSNTQYPNYEIIAVDDRSTDGTREYLKTQNLTLIESDEDKFCYGRNNNKGIRIARGEYICLLNNDTMVKKGWLKELLKLITLTTKTTLKGYGAVGPKAENRYHENNPEFLRFFCVLIRRQVIDEIGLLSEEFVGYGHDDVHYSERIKKAGWKLGMHYYELVKHLDSKSFNRKSNRLLYEITGKQASNNNIARQRLMNINRDVYHRLTTPVFIKPAPVIDKNQIFLDSLRDGSYYDEKFYKKLGTLKSVNVKWDIESTIKETNPKTIIDVGCGQGHDLKKARVKGYVTHGVDISKWACANALSDIRHFIKNGSATNIPYDPNSANLVWTSGMLHRIQNIYTPRVISELGRICKKKGTICVSGLPAMYKDSDAQRKRWKHQHKTNINIQVMEYWINLFRKLENRVIIWFSLDPEVCNEATMVRYDINQVTRSKSVQKEIERLIHATV